MHKLSCTGGVHNQCSTHLTPDRNYKVAEITKRHSGVQPPSACYKCSPCPAPKEGKVATTQSSESVTLIKVTVAAPYQQKLTSSTRLPDLVVTRCLFQGLENWLIRFGSFGCSNDDTARPDDRKVGLRSGFTGAERRFLEEG